VPDRPGSEGEERRGRVPTFSGGGAGASIADARRRASDAQRETTTADC